MRALLLVPLLLALPACKKKRPDEIELAMAKFDEFRNKMCACKDKACADTVQDDMNQWSRENARTAGDRPVKPAEAQMKKMQEIGTQYGECMAKAMQAEPPVDVATPTPTPSPVVALATGDQVVKHVYDTLGSYAVARLGLWYVRADGTIDPKYGYVEIDLAPPRPPDPADDPDRPIGAPIPVAPTADDHSSSDCPTVGWASGALTRKKRPSCEKVEVPLARPKCSAVEIWKRAIDEGAPAQGLAVIELHATPSQHWTFSMHDAPRNIHVLKEIQDTCAPTIERPAP
ncbi:MAG: hypothetical protein H0T46_36485 [Deltaproteobacteria bacterium]|nr:hypothetical protein [Deltaproteobacteria bacterium]